MKNQKLIIGNIMIMMATGNYSEYTNSELRQIIKDLQSNSITTEEASAMIAYVTNNKSVFQK